MCSVYARFGLSGLIVFGCLVGAHRTAEQAMAQENRGPEPTVEALQDEIAALRQEMEEQRRLYEGRIGRLEQAVEKLRAAPPAEPPAEPSIEALRAAARAAVPAETPAKEAGAETFTSGALGLQALNPEISVTGDMLGSYSTDPLDDGHSDFLFRGLGLHLESYLDPFTRFKAAVPVDQHGAELEEAYVTRFGLVPDINVTLGKFRQQLGVVNRWHKHALDQVDFPLALREIFGEGGLCQTGASIDWTMPSVAALSQESVLQITDGENDRLFAENADNTPSGLLHYKLYRDLSPSTYAEAGASALYGQNSQWRVGEAVIDEDQDLWVLGADFSVVWEPTDRMRYHNVTWRSEAYALGKDILAPDGSGPDTIEGWGLYSYLESMISRTLILGIRGDYYEPDYKSYAASETQTLAPLAVSEEDAHLWQIGPYLTWQQSPFVHFRVEYNHTEGEGLPYEDHVLWLQCIFAAGPHKHERY